jgi:hypothetical protein
MQLAYDLHNPAPSEEIKSRREPSLELSDESLHKLSDLIENKLLKQEIKQRLITMLEKTETIKRLFKQQNAKIYYSTIYSYIQNIQRQIFHVKEKLRTSEHSDQVTVLKILKLIEEPYAQLRHDIELEWFVPASVARDLQWKSHALHCEQGLVYGDENINHKFSSILGKIGQLVDEKGTESINPTLFISYAWPTSQNQNQEYWIQPFLQRLGLHLRAANINAILDIGGSRLGGIKVGGDIFEFMEQAKNSDFVLLICSESLLDKHRNGHGNRAINEELNHIKSKREIDAKLGLNRVFPVLVSGTEETSFPIAYKGYFAVQDLRGISYIQIIKLIIGWVHPINIEEPPFQRIWSEFTDQYEYLLSPMDESLVNESLKKQHYQKLFKNTQSQIEYKALLQQIPESDFSSSVIFSSASEEKKSSILSKEEKYLLPSRLDKIPEIWEIPDRNLHFTGRDDLLNETSGQLTQLFNQNKRSTVKVCIAGLGGIGKSELAKEYAYRYKHLYRIVWWFDVANDLSQGFKHFAEKLEAKMGSVDVERKIDSQSDDVIISRVKDRLRTLPNWLLIFDNAEDEEKISNYFPDLHINALGHVLITSQNLHWQNISLLISARIFTLAESVALFHSVLNIPPINPIFYLNCPEGNLAEKLGHLPLALNQAAFYIRENKLSCQEYIDLFKESPGKILSEEPRTLYRTTVAKVWNISFKKINEMPSAIDMLYFSAFLNASKIPKEFLSLAVNKNREEFTAITYLLTRYSLIDNENKCISLHPLLQVVIKDKITNKSKYIQITMEQVLSYLATLFTQQESRSIREFTPYLVDFIPHMISLWNHAKLTWKHPTFEQMVLGSLYLMILSEVCTYSSDNFGKAQECLNELMDSLRLFQNDPIIRLLSLPVHIASTTLGNINADTVARLQQLSQKIDFNLILDQLIGKKPQAIKGQPFLETLNLLFIRILGQKHRWVTWTGFGISVIYLGQFHFYPAYLQLRKYYPELEIMLGSDHQLIKKSRFLKIFFKYKLTAGFLLLANPIIFFLNLIRLNPQNLIRKKLFPILDELFGAENSLIEDLGDQKNHIKILTQTCSILGKVWGTKHIHFIRSQLNVANYLLATDNFQRSIEIFTDQLPHLQQYIGSENIQMAAWQLKLLIAYMAMHEYGKAQAEIDKLNQLLPILRRTYQDRDEKKEEDPPIYNLEQIYLLDIELKQLTNSPLPDEAPPQDSHGDIKKLTYRHRRNPADPGLFVQTPARTARQPSKKVESRCCHCFIL